MRRTRMKLPAILLSIGGGGVALLAWSQTWFELDLTAGAGAGSADGTIQVAGQIASPAIAALGLAALALGGALAIAAPGIRMVLGVLAVVLGGCILLASGITLGDPTAAVGPAVTDATGVAGAGPTAQLVASATATLWPAVAVVGGLCVVAAGVLVLTTGLAWPGPSHRYGDARGARFADAAEAGGSPGRAGSAERPSAAADSSAGESPSSDRAIDDWDDLSRGEDPTG